MNILIEELPTAVEIDGKEYAINTDFRVCLRIILAFEDNSLTAYEKQIVMLENLYPVQPDNIGAAIEQAMKFMNGGKETDPDAEEPDRLYSFAQDANFIFAAFRQTHGIDLETTELHWWKFLALFMDLGKDTTWSQLVGLRKRLKDGTATDDERRAASEMGDLIDVPELDTRTLQEREAEEAFMKAIGAK